MEQVSAQTEKITTYETSRTRRSIVDGNVHSDDSNNDEEFATSGFYVREKSSDKKPDSSESGSKEKEIKETDNKVEENGIASDENSSSNLVTNGETSKDAENSRDSKAASEENNEAEPENKDDPETDKEAEESNKQADTNEESESKTEENNVTSSSSNEVEENVCSTSKKDEENDVSSTSHNVDEPETVESVEEPKKSENENDVENISENNKENEPKTDEKEKETVGDESKTETTELVDDDKEIIEDESKDEEKEKVDVAAKDESKQDEKEKVDVAAKDESKQVEKEKVDAAAKDDKKENDTVDLTDKETSDNKEPDPKETDKKEDDDKSDTSKASILKEQLERASNGNEENSEHEMEMDEDFDPSLLCPDISMDVDEAPVNTNTEPPMEDGSISPLPYEPIFSTLVDEITGAEVHVDLTPEEMELRRKMYGPNNPVQSTKIHCTACNVHLGSALTGANNRFVHPLLKVLICKNCYHFYTSGEFEKDEDGSELYCRWCGQGGQVLCCSSCEFVFCKRCIRNNFGPKKFKLIRDSEDWNCFRCEPEQLSNLRASCAEFMEYYRTELARAQSMSGTNPELMTTDYTKCCSAPPEKKEDAAAKVAVAAKSRRRRKEEDPDFVLDDDEPPSKLQKPAPTGAPGYSVIPPSNVRPIVPKPIQPMVRPATNTTTTSSTVFKVGNTTFKTKTGTAAGYSVQKTATSQNSRNNSPGYITIPPAGAKTATTSPGYIKIIPPRMNTPGRSSGTYTVVSGTSNGKPTFNTVRAAKPPNQMPTMKHEWFEKTVRAAARVNSNLSYTLTQLNRQQSLASSVEALAMVHNKLQEVLSTSINSLIQIRKNLRTEFIAGIKNIKFPPKPAPIPATSGPIVVKDDDDVIFVNPTTTASSSQPPPLVLSPSVTISKKGTIQRTSTTVTSDPFSNPKPSTSGLKTNSLSKPAITTTTTASPVPRKGGFLKVRSFTSLQSVPSECITIPDDPVPAPIVVVEEEDPLKLVEDDPLKVEESKPEQSEVSSTSSIAPAALDVLMVYNVTEKPTPEIKKMMNAIVSLRRSPEVEAQQILKGLVNGTGVGDKKKDGSDPKKIVQSENDVA